MPANLVCQLSFKIEFAGPLHIFAGMWGASSTAMPALCFVLTKAYLESLLYGRFWKKDQKIVGNKRDID